MSVKYVRIKVNNISSPSLNIKLIAAINSAISDLFDFKVKIKKKKHKTVYTFYDMTFTLSDTFESFSAEIIPWCTECFIEYLLLYRKVTRSQIRSLCSIKHYLEIIFGTSANFHYYQVILYLYLVSFRKLKHYYEIKSKI